MIGQHFHDELLRLLAPVDFYFERLDAIVEPPVLRLNNIDYQTKEKIIDSNNAKIERGSSPSQIGGIEDIVLVEHPPVA